MLSQDMGVKLLHFLERLVEEVTAALPGFHRRVLPGETDGAHPSAWNGFSSLPVTAVVPPDFSNSQIHIKFPSDLSPKGS